MSHPQLAPFGRQAAENSPKRENFAVGLGISWRWMAKRVDLTELDV
jgi:hypothetical protein